MKAYKGAPEWINDVRSPEFVAYMCEKCNYTPEQYLEICDGNDRHNDAGLDIVANILEKQALKKIELQKAGDKNTTGYKEYVAKKTKSYPKKRR